MVRLRIAAEVFEFVAGIVVQETSPGIGLNAESPIRRWVLRIGDPVVQDAGQGQIDTLADALRDRARWLGTAATDIVVVNIDRMVERVVARIFHRISRRKVRQYRDMRGVVITDRVLE